MLRVKTTPLFLTLSVLCSPAFGSRGLDQDAGEKTATQKLEAEHAAPLKNLAVVPVAKTDSEDKMKHLDDPDFSYWNRFLPGHCPQNLLILLKGMKFAIVRGDKSMMSKLVDFPVVVNYGGTDVRLNHKQFLKLYNSIFTYNIKSMILRANLTNIHEDMAGDTWGLFAGYGDIWVGRKSQGAKTKITRIDTEKAPVYAASTTGANGPNISEDRACIESFLNRIRSTDEKSSISIIGSSLVTPIVLCNGKEVKIESSDELKHEDKIKLFQLLRDPNESSMIEPDTMASPYSVYRVEFDKAVISMEVVSDTSDSQKLQLKVQIYRIDWR